MLRVAARCWVGLFAEAVRNPALFKRMRNLIDAEEHSRNKRPLRALPYATFQTWRAARRLSLVLTSALTVIPMD